MTGSRRLLPVVTCAAILLLAGGLLDRSLGIAGLYAGSDRSPSLTLAQLADSYGDRFGSYGIIRSEGPQSVVFLDSGAVTSLDMGRLYAFAEVRVVEFVDVDFDFVRRLGPADITLQTGSVASSFWISAGSVPAFLVTSKSSTANGTDNLIVDVRLAPRDVRAALPALSELGPTHRAESGGWLSALREWALYAGLLFVGACLVPRSFSRYVRPPLALLVGFCMAGITSLLFLPGLTGTLPMIAAAILARLFIFRSWRVWGREDMGPAALFLAAVAILVVSIHSTATVIVSADSFSYLVGGHELAEGRLGLEDLSLKRGAFLQGLYGLGFAAGVDILVAPGVAALFAAAVLLVGFGWARSQDWMQRVIVVGIAAAPWLHVQPLSMARYVNSHVYVTSVLLALGLTLHWAAAQVHDRQYREFAVMAIPLAAAPVLLRAEGVLLVALLLLGATRASRRVFEAAWWAVGGMTMLWAALLYAGAVRGGVEPSGLLAPLGVLGLGLLLVPAFWRRQRLLWDQMPFVAVALLWAFTLLLTTGITGRASNFVNAAVINLGEGRGRWGLFAPTLFLIAVFVVGLEPRSRNQVAEGGARLLLLGFIPVSVIAKLGDGVFRGSGSIVNLLFDSRGGGRVGWGDSVNRMWMHAVMAALLLAVIRFTGGERQPRSPASRSSTRPMQLSQ